MGSISDPLCSPTHEIPNNAVVPVSSINISLSRRSFILDWRCSAHTRRAPTTSARSVSIASSVLFKAELLHAQNRESGAGCTVSAFSASRRAASSGIVISPSASTQPISTSICAASRPLPGGRPCRDGATDPVSALPRASRTAVAGATPNRRPIRLTALNLPDHPDPKIP